MAKIKRDPKKVALAQAILDAYQPKSAEEMNDALKDLFGPMFEAMLKGELNHHLGYESNDKSQKKDDNRLLFTAGNERARKKHDVRISLLILHRVVSFLQL